MTTPPETATIVPRLLIEPDRVIMRGALGARAAEAFLGYSAREEGSKEFFAAFDYVEGPGSSEWFLADPAEDFDGTVQAMTVIRRLSDGCLFGYTFRTSVHGSERGTPQPNGDDHGLGYTDPGDEACLRFEDGEPVRWQDPEAEDDPFEVWVWLPVQPFTITGYAFTS